MINVSLQIREQQDSLQEYIKGLYEWEQEIKKKDAVLLEKAKSGIKSERTVSTFNLFLS